MNELDEQLARRDRFMRRWWAAMSPDKRIQAMMDLQQKAWDLLRSSPQGYAHFLRRNFKARAMQNAATLHKDLLTLPKLRKS